MDLIKICTTSILLGACLAPVAQATDRDYNNFVEGALEIYKQFQEPSVDESQKFLSFVNKRWKANNEACITNVCSIDGQTAGLAYATVNKVKLDDDI